MDSSKFNVWRACIAFCFIDKKFSDEERNWIAKKNQNLKLTIEQREILKKELNKPGNLDDIITGITKPYDLAFLIDQLRILAFVDGILSTEEKNKIGQLKDMAMSKVNIPDLNLKLADAPPMESKRNLLERVLTFFGRLMKGAIFDMDGVVVDNHKYHFKAWMAFADKHNFELNEKIYRDKFNGKTNADLFYMIFGGVTPDQMKKFADEKEGMYQKLYLEHMKAHTGLLDFLDYLQKRRIKIALGTSAPTSNVDFTLDTLKLRKYFEVIVDGSQVERGKPDPQVYQMCAMKLGLEPKDCFVFEDSLAGLESGQRAGCKIVGVATSHEAFELKVKTDLIIHDFTEARALLKI